MKDSTIELLAKLINDLSDEDQDQLFIELSKDDSRFGHYFEE